MRNRGRRWLVWRYIFCAPYLWSLRIIDFGTQTLHQNINCRDTIEQMAEVHYKKNQFRPIGNWWFFALNPRHSLAAWFKCKGRNTTPVFRPARTKDLISVSQRQCVSKGFMGRNSKSWFVNFFFKPLFPNRVLSLYTRRVDKLKHPIKTIDQQFFAVPDRRFRSNQLFPLAFVSINKFQLNPLHFHHRYFIFRHAFNFQRPKANQFLYSHLHFSSLWQSAKFNLVSRLIHITENIFHPFSITQLRSWTRHIKLTGNFKRLHSGKN